MNSKELRAHAETMLALPGVLDDELHLMISGVCSSPAVDTYGESLDPRGARFQLPVPLLLEHVHTAVVGWVTELTAGAAIHFTARVANGTLAWAVPTWGKLRSGELDGISVGLEVAERGVDPRDVALWSITELSIVPRGANEDAKVHRVWVSRGPGLVRLGNAWHGTTYRDVRGLYEAALPRPKARVVYL
jgi:uncharacterized protein